MIVKNRDDAARLIKSAAALRGENIPSIAEKIGISAPTLNRSINHSDMRLSQLIRIASALGLRLEISFTEEETQNKDKINI